MKKADATRERLLTQARALMWSRGYGAVSLREVAQAAGVDVALVSRYFGGKQGLFEATLEGAFEMPDVENEAQLVEIVARLFADAPRGGETPSVLQLIQTNANDADVGPQVRAAQARGMQDELDALLGSPVRAALFMSVLMGFAVAEKTLKLPGIAPPTSPEFQAQLRHLMASALAFKG